MDDNKPSRKKKRVKQPKDVVVPPPVNEEELLPISKMEKINIEQIFAQALTEYRDELPTRRKPSDKEFDHLNSMVEEYLSCFALVGFSLDGDKVCIFNATNAKDESALVDHLRSTFMEIVGNRQ